MKGKDVFRGIQFLDPKFIDQAEFGDFSPEAFYKEIDRRQAVRKPGFRRVFLIAAAIALTALLVGCGIVYVLKMQDLKL